MRRLLILIVLLLGCGVATSIGLAWLSASMIRPALGDNRFFMTQESDRDAINGWSLAEIRDRGMTMRYFWPEANFAPPVNNDYDPPAYSAAHRPAPSSRLDQEHWRAPDVFGVEKEHGWPLRCMRTHWIADDCTASLPSDPLRFGVLIKPVRWGLMPTMVLGQPSMTYVEAERRYALPLRPMVWGLLANSLLFACVWGIATAPFSLIGFLIGQRRRRKSRCARCGYDLSGASTPVCSECGWAVSKRTPVISKWSIRVATAMFVLCAVATVASEIGERAPCLTCRQSIAPQHEATSKCFARNWRGALTRTYPPQMVY